MKVAKNCFSTIEIEIKIVEIHDISKSELKLKYSKRLKLKSNWPHISVIEIERHIKIETTLSTRVNELLMICDYQ